MKIEISPLRMMAASGVFVFAVWISVFSIEGFTTGAVFFALVALILGIGFAFLCSLAIDCSIDEDGIHRDRSTALWDTLASATITKGLTAIVIRSPDINSKGWIAIPAPWFVANRSEVAQYIKFNSGTNNPLYLMFHR